MPMNTQNSLSLMRDRGVVAAQIIDPKLYRNSERGVLSKYRIGWLHPIRTNIIAVLFDDFASADFQSNGRSNHLDWDLDWTQLSPALIAIDILNVQYSDRCDQKCPSSVAPLPPHVHIKQWGKYVEDCTVLLILFCMLPATRSILFNTCRETGAI